MADYTLEREVFPDSLFLVVGTVTLAHSGSADVPVVDSVDDFPGHRHWLVVDVGIGHKVAGSGCWTTDVGMSG